MFKKNDKVKVKPCKRTRTIFGNAEYNPGRTTQYPGGWEGTITGIFEGLGEDIIEVCKPSKSPEAEGSYYDFSPQELEAI